MKNIINYYYNLNVKDIKQKNKETHFFVNNIRYVFFPYQNEFENVKEIYEMDKKLLSMGVMVHEIILNINGQILTFANGKYYILLKVFNYEGKPSLKDILYLNSIPLEGNVRNYANMWSEKNDYMEYQMNQFSKKYPILNESFNYYIGLSECAIALINSFNFNEKLYLSHKRISKDVSFFELYNPLNIISDYKVRDVSEYFKSNFFDDKDIKKELIKFLSYNYLSYNEWVIFFIRMLYPSYYFDFYEDVINDRVSENEKMIEKNKEYENILSFIYLNLRKYPSFPIIDFLEKKSFDINDFFN